jgi:DNA-binding transcriptional MocR family regulator
VALAREHEFTVIEDTVLDPLRYDGAPAEPLWGQGGSTLVAVDSAADRGAARPTPQAALRHGVAIAPGAASSPDQAFPEYVRISFGPEPPLLEEAARRLTAAWAEFTPAAPPVTRLA